MYLYIAPDDQEKHLFHYIKQKNHAYEQSWWPTAFHALLTLAVFEVGPIKTIFSRNTDQCSTYFSY